MAMIMVSLKLNDRLLEVENTFITSSVIKFNNKGKHGNSIAPMSIFD